ncbi:MAG: hypothetical protein NTV09_06605 [Bacteroidetes bacterium]|nr:hypothetical protein [Bacteroidota bacterium]
MKFSAYILLICTVALQACKTKELKYGFIRKKKTDSYRQIIDLKEGSLLVMLHSRQNQIDTLKNMERSEEAVSIQKKQSEKNKAIIKGFHKHFDFCPVYFFMNTQANDLIEKGADSVTFLNDSLKQDTSIRLTSKYFLVAEFGNMQMDTAKYYNGDRLSTQDTGAWRKPYYYSTSTFDYQAFIFESPQLVQLKSPFPYFVMITETERKILLLDSIVTKADRRLKYFYQKANEQILIKRFRPYFKDKIKISN